MRARFYNSVIGRFTQEDIYRGDGLNLYAYCGNNPVVYYDPSGYMDCKSKTKSANGNHFDGEYTLKPNETYTVNGYGYKTDNLGRITNASGQLKEVLPKDKRKRNNKHQLEAGGEDRITIKGNKDHGGHLIAIIFDGSPLVDNIVAMIGNVNTSAYKKLENMWADAVKAKQKVVVDISPKYKGDSLRPDSFRIKYSIDGVKAKAVVKNIKGGK